MMLSADVVYVFGSWYKSTGVRLELQVAGMLDMPVVFEQEGKA